MGTVELFHELKSYSYMDSVPCPPVRMGTQPRPAPPRSGRQFIKRGYGVIYLSRQGCAAPFARRIQELVSPHIDLNFMDRLVLGGE